MKTEYLTLHDLGAILKKRILPILLAALLAALLGFAARVLLPPKYSATATFYVRNLQSERFLEANGLTTSQRAAVQTLAKEYAALLTEGDALLDRMIARHALPLTREALRDMLTAAPHDTAFTVTATARETAVADAVIAAVQAELPHFIQETAWPQLEAEYPVVVLLRAAAPAARSTASPLVWGALGALGGFLLTYLFFILYFLFSNRLADAAEIERVLTDTPLLGVIPEIKPPADAAEPFYALRERLPRADGTQAVTLAVTSPQVGEGKSYVLAALAKSLAVAGKRVLVIDADLRRGGKEAFFLPEAEPGLSEYLADPSLDPKKLVHPSTCKGVWLVPTGLAPLSPCDYPMSDRIAALLAAYAADYEYILVDFPAVTHAVDITACVADFVGTLMIAASGRCGARELRSSLSALKAVGGTVLGVVANTPPKDAFIKPQKSL